MSNRIRNQKKRHLKHLKKHRAPRSEAGRDIRQTGSVLPPFFGGLTVKEMVEEIKFLQENSAKVEKTILERTKSWCQANGVEPHPRLSSAARYMSGALMVAKRSKLPEGQSEAEVMRDALFTIMKGINEADPVAMTHAVEQISAAFNEPDKTEAL